MKFSNRKSVSEELKKYCHLSTENSFIEITEWSNGEGIDITISNSYDRTFSLTYGELELINILANIQE